MELLEELLDSSSILENINTLDVSNLQVEDSLYIDSSYKENAEDKLEIIDELDISIVTRQIPIQCTMVCASL